MFGNEGMIQPVDPFYRDGSTIKNRENDDLEIRGTIAQNIKILSYDDTTLSGTPVIIRIDYKGTYYYAKVYPTASATANETIDDIGSNIRGIDDATRSGLPRVFEIISGGTSYYFKAYPTISAEAIASRGITPLPVSYDDTTISGTPRVASMQIGGTDHHLKVYPTKS